MSGPTEFPLLLTDILLCSSSWVYNITDHRATKLKFLDPAKLCRERTIFFLLGSLARVFRCTLFQFEFAWCRLFEINATQPEDMSKTEMPSEMFSQNILSKRRRSKKAFGSKVCKLNLLRGCRARDWGARNHARAPIGCTSFPSQTRVFWNFLPWGVPGSFRILSETENFKSKAMMT